ncbi:MAG TPA: hypothetical protein VF598_12950, partial [Hymenobacter sp.]
MALVHAEQAQSMGVNPNFGSPEAPFVDRLLSLCMPGRVAVADTVSVVPDAVIALLPNQRVV